MRIVSGKILSNSKLKKVKLSNFEASLMAGFSCYCCFLVPLVTVCVCVYKIKVQNIITTLGQNLTDCSRKSREFEYECLDNINMGHVFQFS